MYSVFQPTPFSIGFAELSNQASSSNNQSSHSTPVKTIVGVVVGVVVLLLICGGLGRRRYTGSVVVRPPEFAVVTEQRLVRIG